jgi:hypothetical protein
MTEPTLILGWMTQVLRGGGTPYLVGYASALVQICQMARESGIELLGARVSLGCREPRAARGTRGRREPRATWGPEARREPLAAWERRSEVTAVDLARCVVFFRRQHALPSNSNCVARMALGT